MKFRLPSIHKLSPIFTVIVFGFAVWVIYHELHDHPISQIMADIGKIDPTSVLLALALVIPGLSALACYDLVAARYLKLGIGWVKPFFTGLLGYTITNSTGHQVIVGGVLRLRFYPRWGVTGKQVGEVLGFGVLTYYLGLTFTTAVAFMLEGGDLAEILGKVPVIGTVIGHQWFRIAVPAVLMTGIIGWFVLLILRKEPIRFRKQQFRLPHPLIGVLQLIVSVADLAIAASVLYVILPSHHGLEWISFVGIFSVVQFCALMSLVPGGIGVFSGIMLVMLRPIDPSGSEVLASLLAFRVIYYLLPFGIGGLSFLGIVIAQNAHRHKEKNSEESTPEAGDAAS